MFRDGSVPEREDAHVTRAVHLVGSTPFDSTAQAMDITLERLGGRLRTLPDGETGERRNWIIHIIESLRTHPDLEVAREGKWGDYNDRLTFRVRRGHSLRGETLDFGHVASFEAAYPLFQERRERLLASGVQGASELAFQVGIPGDFDMALFTLGPLGALQHRPAFAHATVREIRAIFERAGSNVVFQLEIPVELVFIARSPRLLQPAVARWLGGGVAALAAQCPEGTRFGIHLCVGDMNHKALARMRDTGPLVRLANAIAQAWPAQRPLEFIHAPLAAAEEPPPGEPAFFTPLRELRLPPSMRFIAGFVHEGQSLEEQRALLRQIESLMGRTVDVASACGLGRRQRERALAVLERSATLCDG